MMFKIRYRGSFDNTERFFKNAAKLTLDEILHRYGAYGVEMLSRMTPVDTGLTAKSWNYTIENTKTGLTLTFRNTNVQDGWANVAVLIQYGHATGTGGYVQGIDYINPALRPIFESIAKDIGDEVSKL